MINQDELSGINSILLEGEEVARIEGANRLLKLMDVSGRVKSVTQAETVLKKYLDKLLENNDYLSAASLMFSRDLFDTRPTFVSEIFDKMSDPETKLLTIPGASGCGKSFVGGVWMALDYMRDPKYTKVRFCSMKEQHLKDNLFGHVITMINQSAIPTELHTKNLFIGYDANVNDYCISGLSFPQDETKASGRLRGIKAGNRAVRHPIWGNSGRLRLLIDEGQNVSESAYMDLPSIISQMGENDMTKIVIAGNPDEQSVPRSFGRISEPIDGWDSIDIETDHTWTSKEGWEVLRLDGDRCENIANDKVIYPGMMSPTGYKAIQAQGLNKWMTFCRGWFPVNTGFDTVIRPEDCSKNVAECIFPHGYVDLATVDLAIRSDRVVLTHGRWGACHSIKKAGEKIDQFVKPRHMLQVMQQYSIEGIHDSMDLAKEIMKICKQIGVSPEWLAVDSTVGGEGVYSYLRNYFGDLLGLEWGVSPTGIRSLAESEKLPNELYNRISDEMWFVMADWLRAGAMRFHPSMSNQGLFRELTTRKSGQNTSSGRMRVEGKSEYKARNRGESPDYADSCIQLPQLVRMRGSILPGMETEESMKKEVSHGPLPETLDVPMNLSFTKPKAAPKAIEDWERDWARVNNRSL